MQRFSMIAYKCVVELAIHEISAPGVRLANKDDLYVNICLLGQQRRTRLVQAQFPLKFNDNLIFEKTFKFCRNELDVINFLDDLHVLIELVQLGRNQKNEVLAWFETNARDFLYPSRQDNKICYNSALRDLFLTKSNDFPGSISPQLIFSTSVIIDETQTPSLDILREYENRFVHDPLIDIKKKKSSKKKHAIKKPMVQFDINRRDFGVYEQPKIIRNPSFNQEKFATHTISSAIKGDYGLADVKYKIDELNSSVKKTKIVKTKPTKGSKSYRSITPKSFSSTKPFVVRKVEDKLILRKPELHDVLHDGLVLTKIVGGSKQTRREKKRRAKQLSRSNSLTNMSALRSRSLNSSPSPSHHYHHHNHLNRSLTEEWAHGHHLNLSNSSLAAQNNSSLFDTIYSDVRDRMSRSMSPLGKSLNENLARENNRKHSRHSSAGSVNSRRSIQSNRTYDINDSRDNLSNCEVCQDHSYRSDTNRIVIDHDDTKGHQMNKSVTNQLPTPPNHKEWPYARYYPWLHNYTEYLRELEDELYWLKVRSRFLNHH